MDPQQRLLLEAAWEVLEDAGVDPASVAGSATGVFTGVMRQDYWQGGSGPAELEAFQGVGSAGSVVSGRIAYALDLEGPAMTVDTACSSSLVAMHLAAQALRGGECDLALAGGVTVMATPWPFIEFSRQRGLAADGRCKPFAKAADGTGFSEGVGLVLLERLSDAQRNGHEVLALIRGSATNQDGASNGITAPNGPAQEKVIRQALANAGLEPGDVDAVEAHGTGTTLGDPIEAQALLATYGQDRGGAEPLKLGAIKSNLGHTQAAAGVAGVIKMAMAMRHGVLPKTLHLDEPSEHVDWSAGAVELLDESQPWKSSGHPRRAGVSSFGISGSNAHLILEEAPAAEVTADSTEMNVEPAADERSGKEAPELPATPLPLSAKGPEALREQASRLAEHLRVNPDLGLGDVAFSLATSRAKLEHRATAIGSHREELLEALGALAEGKPHPNLIQGRATQGRLAFLFSGQGAQRPGMGKELYESFPAFAEALDEICAELDPLLDRSLKELLFAEQGSDDASLLDATQFTQPALFALEVALFRQLQDWDLAPDYLLGHSIGELAAAHVAGVFSLSDAARLIAARGALMGALPEGGAMVAIEASEEEIAKELPEGLSIAGINAPDSVVVSGSEAATLKLAETWKDKGRKTTRLRVSHAFHSELMEPMLDEFAAVAQTVSFNPPRIPVLSNLSGEPLTPEQATDPAYWVAQVRQPVRFADGAAYLAAQGVCTCLELGPDGVLCAMSQGSFAAAEKEAVAVPLLRKDRQEATALLGALAAAQANGAPLQWQRLLPRASRVPLPTYAFQRRRYWLEPSAPGGDASANGQGASDHPLLSAAISLPGGADADGGWLLTGRLSLQTHPWLADHAVHGTPILPGTAFVEMALKAAGQCGAEAIEELILDAPLALPERGAVQVQVAVGAADEDGSRSIAIHSRPEDTHEPDREWSTNATGSLGPAEGEQPEPLTEWPPAAAVALGFGSLHERIGELGLDHDPAALGSKEKGIGALYELSADFGMIYGPAFQGVREVWLREGELFAEVELGEAQAREAGRFLLHPALLDAALQPALMVASAQEGERGFSVPFNWRGMRLPRAGAARLRIAIAHSGTDTLSLRIADSAGEPLTGAISVGSRPVPPEFFAAAAFDQHRDSLFVVEWVERSPAGGGIEEASVVELAPDPELAPDAAAQALCAEVLATLQEAIAANDDSRLAFLTRGAVAAAEGESPDPAAAAAWGLVRSAQAEHPDRFLLIDSDDSEASREALAAVLATEAEPQLALREGVVLAARLARGDSERVEPEPLDPERTVLVTGGTGALGALFARHLVTEQGARHLLLTSRRGPAAPGAGELTAELERLGAEVRIAACDVADRGQLRELLDSIPANRPLGAVLHAAAVFDNSLIEAMGDEQLERVLSAKAGAAWHLHELTRDLGVTELVLFSSIAGTFNNPGQGNYAAANAFLDALAQRRRAEGLPARSVAWGPWDPEAGGPGQALREADLARLARAGFLPIAPAQGLELFERVRGLAAPGAVAAPLDLAALRALARRGELSPLHSGIIRRLPDGEAKVGGTLAERLGAAPEAEREGIAMALVAEQAAAVLGHVSAAAIDPRAAFRDLGFDSLGAIELRNRLAEASGLKLPSTLLFDHPTPAAVAAFMRRWAEGAKGAERSAVGVMVAGTEPVAIVGIGCHFPGGVHSPDDLWRMVAAGAEAVSDFPQNRNWDLDGLYDPDPANRGTSYVRRASFLEDVAGFDAEFFGVGPREALAMDPQQRLLLETAWEALEEAGIDPESLRGTATGVFAGAGLAGYNSSATHSEELTGHYLTGDAPSVLSGRVAYSLGLEGPAVTVDTACSSSLVAMHLAAAAVRTGECDLAFAGGVTILSDPALFVELSRQRVLSPDGRCKPFAAAADGAGWAEGAGLVLLERLSDAERNGHEVLALVRGSATNQDGASNGITAPNGPSQEKVIRQALANAGLQPGEVDAVEAHGTGTTLGDPIEAQALLATYGQDRGEAEPLKLGAIKSNLGHTQAAAGVAGVIKMTMAMRHGTLPKTLHLDEPSPHVDWEAGAVELLGEAQPWEPNGHPRRAGVSSFGISGTNAHLILEEAPKAEAGSDLGSAKPEPGSAAAEQPADQQSGEEAPALPAIPLPLSAKGPEALREQAERLVSHLGEHPELDPTDVAFSLATSRTAFEHRATAIGSDREELLEALGALATGKPHPSLIQGRATQGRLAFLFSGQGAQRPGMGKELYESFPAFAKALDEICAELDPLLDRSLKDLLFAEEGSDESALLDATQFTQPALFALEVALFRQLQAWDLAPDYLLGHSIGELAAAHVAGVFDLPDACRLIAARGALMGALPEGGAMVAIEASEQEIAKDLPEGLSIAGINAPDSVVVSGSEDAALKLAETWKEKGRKTTRLRVSHAFHSELMEPMLGEFAEVAETISFNPPRIPVLSNLSGEPLTPEQATDPAYWVAQVRQPVRFADGAAYLAAQGVSTAVELGPDGVLCAMAQDSFAAAEKEAVAVPLLRKDRAESSALLGALAAAQANGAPLDWAGLLPGAKRVPLPTYAFQRKRYWNEPAMATGDPRVHGQSASDHPLLGAAISLPSQDGGEQGWLLTGRLSLQTHSWLTDHAVHGTPILPGTAFVEMALKAGEQAGAPQVEELTIEVPLTLPERGAVQVQVRVAAADVAGNRPLTIHSRPEEQGDPEREWVTNAEGVVGPASSEPAESLGEWPPPGAVPLDVDALYERTAERGIDYGAAFQGVKAAWRRNGETFAEVELDEGQAKQARRFRLHPALLAAVLQTGILDEEVEDEARMPVSWSGVRLHRAAASSLRIALAPRGADTFAVTVADSGGEPLAAVRSLAVRSLPVTQAAPGQDEGDPLFAIEWAEQKLPAAQDRETRVVECSSGEALDPAAAAKALCEEVLGTLRAAIAGPEEARLALLTHGAVAAGEAESPDPAAAAVWGLVRSAQAEHPGRFVLVDTDGSAASAAALAAALAIEGEPQLALREGVALAPRLVRAEGAATEPRPLDPERTVLITGATGALGSLFARHLIVAHGARRLLLAGRRGPDAPGAEELAEELEGLGAKVRLVACDVGERSQLEQLLASIPAEHPLGAVFHAATAFANDLIASLEPEPLGRVLDAKAKAAWDLHDLTREMELSEFVLFSSIAGTFDSPGQGSYAAANAFLDALAQRRRSEGLVARSIAWGPWDRKSSGPGDALGAADMARLERAGFLSFPAARGLELFESCRGLSAPSVLAVPLDFAVLRARARRGDLPPVYAGLVRIPVRRVSGRSGSLARILADAPEAEREEIVVAFVATHAAAILGHASMAAIDPDAAFKDLGFDSLSAVELRNRLIEATGLPLPSTLIFDYPTTAAAASLLRRLAEGQGSAPAAVRVAPRSEEPLAIVGMSCRYPGGVESAEGLWRLVAAGADAIAPFPGDRGWDLERLYDPDPDHRGTSCANEGGFLYDAAEFDAGFFGISPREALATDPQQRLLLEAAWEAFEEAGMDPSSVRGAAVGVFAGFVPSEYNRGGAFAAEADGYYMTGTAPSVLSGRVAYSFGLEGPAMTVDTACSSSLVAMHLAGQSLRGGECDLALAGGVSVMPEPVQFLEFSRQGGQAPDGRCKPFARAADGTGWSEGVGLVLLERLSDAERNGHEVLALVRGSATNQDGASNGLTAPNGPSQERVIRQALANAGLRPEEVDAVEAHGTGTTLGDPIEAQALLATYGQDRGEAEPLKLGAIKSNLGHTQAAAGVAGVIKMAMAMRHGVLPKTLHLDELSPHVDWGSGELELLTEDQPWKPNGHPRRAGISAFGVSGTNAHLILEEAPAVEVTAGSTETESELPAIPLPLSAKGPEALREQAERLAGHLGEHPELEPADVAFSLATTRAKLEHRATAIGESREQLLEILGALAEGKPHPNLIQGRATQGRLAFLFSGQGAQRPGMGRELYEAFPAFAEALDQICAELDPQLDRSLRKLLFAKAGSKKALLLDRTEFTQPALFALEVALFRLLRGLGPRPRLPARPLDRRAGRGSRRRGLRSSRRRQADRRQGRPDGSPARGRGDGRDRGHRGGDREGAPRRPLDRGHQRPRLRRRLRPGSFGPEAGRDLEGQRPQDHPPAGLPRLPLRADGADAG